MRGPQRGGGNKESDLGRTDQKEGEALHLDGDGQEAVGEGIRV